jgi:hypothetical protein
MEKLRDQQFKTEQRIAEEKILLKAIKKEQQRTALPWYRKTAALLDLYWKTLTAIILVSLFSLSVGIAIGILAEKTKIPQTLINAGGGRGFP